MMRLGWLLLGFGVGTAAAAITNDAPVAFGKVLDPSLVPMSTFPCEPTAYDFPGWVFRVGPIDTVVVMLHDGTNLGACTIYTPRPLVNVQEPAY